jgi:preprotein translocase subunit SecY
MLEKIRVIFTIPELRRKILLTLGLLAVYRVGWQIPLPVIDPEALRLSDTSGTLGDFLQRVSVFSASQINQATIFGLGIMPYISASIMLQLLGTVYPPLIELRKEGEAGRKKINNYTRILTLFLCLLQSTAYLWWAVMARDLTADQFENAAGNLTIPWQIASVLIMTCGAMFLMWLGEQIDEFGIGNGISLLIMAGIVASIPGSLATLFGNAKMQLAGSFGSGDIGLETIVVLIMLFFAVVAGVVFITLAQRRIPTQSAKHVRGNRVYGGTRQYMPLRINQAGVMPIIFASSLLMLPPLFFGYIENMLPSDTWLWSIFHNANDALNSQTSIFYNIAFIAMIYFFCYFWTAITFNPKEISENLKDSGTFIPGYRPGRRTAEYLELVIERITYVGAGFLALVAVIPTIISIWLVSDQNLASFYGGTSLLIAVSVAFDLVQKIDSHLVMRNYKGLLE